ncbi:Transthyretin-like family protein [Ancylostoma duodenale]|uniref:Transthyretin-like family protein n=1 Tax=Ancylostoma duodenale TaxID=51022 RepID=A0A0C2GX44_9BILA|nr:Transthyretin-like family protein [Ancylostoma duodenale]
MRAVIFLLLMSSCYGINFDQSVGVKGILRCNGKAAKGIEVKLYDEDLVGLSLMAEAKTDQNGAFKLSGTDMDLRSDIDPILNIHHRCNYAGQQVGIRLTSE